MNRLEPLAVWHLVGRILSQSGALVLGASADWRYRLTSILYYINRKKMRHPLPVVIGGRIPDSASCVGRMGGYRRAYVEAESTKRLFETVGTQNVAIYPNCRERPVFPVRLIVRKVV